MPSLSRLHSDYPLNLISLEVPFASAFEPRKVAAEVSLGFAAAVEPRDHGYTSLNSSVFDSRGWRRMRSIIRCPGCFPVRCPMFMSFAWPALVCSYAASELNSNLAELDKSLFETSGISRKHRELGVGSSSGDSHSSWRERRCVRTAQRSWASPIASPSRQVHSRLCRHHPRLRQVLFTNRIVLGRYGARLWRINKEV